MSRPKFITVEGGEGAGKSTLLRGLADHLGGDVVVTREPGGCKLSESIRELLLSSNHSIDPHAETLLFLASRAQHIAEVIAPALSAGKTVLCDRFHDSTVAYQGYARGLGLDHIEHLCLAASDDLQPDLTFLIDIDPALGLERAGRVSGPDRMESEALEFHQRVNEGFRKIARRHSNRIHVLDGSLPPGQVLSQAIEALQCAI